MVIHMLCNIYHLITIFCDVPNEVSHTEEHSRSTLIFKIVPRNTIDQNMYVLLAKGGEHYESLEKLK